MAKKSLSEIELFGAAQHIEVEYYKVEKGTTTIKVKNADGVLVDKEVPRNTVVETGTSNLAAHYKGDMAAVAKDAKEYIESSRHFNGALHGYLKNLGWQLPEYKKELSRGTRALPIRIELNGQEP